MRRTIILLATLTVVVSACGGETAVTTTTTPGATSSTEAPSTTTAPAEPQDVTITSGGFALDATVWPGGPIWVVLGHMLPADKSSWTGFAAEAQKAGFTVLAYNNRGYGNSEGDKEPFQLYTDAAAAIAHAQENGARQVIYGGASMNGATAIKLGEFYEFEGIMALSPVATFPSVTNAVDSAHEVYEPVLIVAAEDDGNATTVLDRFLDALGSGGDWIVLPSGGHGTDMLFTNPDLTGQIIDWMLGL
jgi:pimeloyl-ACP methyl ester carboxylesterase